MPLSCTRRRYRGVRHVSEPALLGRIRGQSRRERCRGLPRCLRGVRVSAAVSHCSANCSGCWKTPAACQQFAPRVDGMCHGLHPIRKRRRGYSWSRRSRTSQPAAPYPRVMSMRWLSFLTVHKVVTSLGVVGGSSTRRTVMVGVSTGDRPGHTAARGRTRASLLSTISCHAGCGLPSWSRAANRWRDGQHIGRREYLEGQVRITIIFGANYASRKETLHASSFDTIRMCARARAPTHRSHRGDRSSNGRVDRTTTLRSFRAMKHRKYLIHDRYTAVHGTIGNQFRTLTACTTSTNDARRRTRSWRFPRCRLIAGATTGLTAQDFVMR